LWGRAFVPAAGFPPGAERYEFRAACRFFPEELRAIASFTLKFRFPSADLMPDG